MGRIFGQALRTTVWLGEGDDTTEAAFGLIKKIASLDAQPEELLNTIRRGSEDEKLYMFRHVLDPLGLNFVDSEPGWKALKNLSSRPWFARLRTFQDFVLSPVITLLCGEHSCSQYDLLHAFLVIYHRQTLEPLLALLPGIKNFIIRCEYSIDHLLGRSSHLLNVVESISRGEVDCADPRDRIYALLALQDPQRPSPIRVDYRKPIHAVFSEAAKAIMFSTQSLSVLHRRRLGDVEGLPSWARNWASASRNEDGRLDDEETAFSCSNGLRYVFEESAPGCLITNGRHWRRLHELPHTHSRITTTTFKTGKLVLSSEHTL